MRLVGVRGLGPRTSSLSVKCSNQLSYTPLIELLNSLEFYQNISMK